MDHVNHVAGIMMGRSDGQGAQSTHSDGHTASGAGLLQDLMNPVFFFAARSLLH